MDVGYHNLEELHSNFKKCSFAEKLEAKITLGELNLAPEKKQEAPTFKTYANHWLEDYIKPLRQRSTYSGIVTS